MGHLDEAFKYEDQLGPLWDVQILGNSTAPDNITKIKFKVQDASIPFHKLVAERKFSGHTFWKGIEDLDSLQITLRESPDFSTFKFFNSWQNKVYDYKKRVFNVQKNETDVLYDICITFYNGTQADTVEEWKNADSIIRSDRGHLNFTRTLNKPTYKFMFYNCKILGLDTLSLNYDGNPLLYTVNLLPETYDLI